MKNVVLAVVFSALSAVAASAEMLVDTGQPEHGPPPFTGYALHADWFWAIDMNLEEPTKITSIGLYGSVDNPGELIVSIVGNRDGLPAEDDEILAKSVRYEGKLNSPAKWHTLNDIDTTLEPGAYWVMFEVPSSSRVFMTTPRHDTATALTHVHRKRSEKWSKSKLDIGVRIEGSTVAE